jgi:hypothetical protein
MTKVQLLLLVSNIWLASSVSSVKGKTFAYVIGLFYLLAAIIIGLLGK